MRYIKRFFESNSYKMEEKLDFLSTQIDEKNIVSKYLDENLLYIEYENLTTEDIKSLKQYLNGDRFIYDVVCFIPERHPAHYINILIVNDEFYDRNLNILYKNIKWVEHPLFTNLKSTSTGVGVDYLLDRYKDAKRADELPNGVSMIKNLDRPGEIEIWDQRTMEDPANFYEKDDCDMVTLQYLLYKHCGK